MARLPLSLRTWSGVLLLCALFACLTGLDNPGAGDRAAPDGLITQRPV